MPVANPQQTLHVVSHTHWDREWYLTFQQFRIRLVRVIDDLLDLLEAGDGFRCFHLDGQGVVLEDYVEIRPENAERLRRQVAAGRLLCGPWYVLPDEFLISGEAHVRNLLVGREVVGRFGPPMEVGYLPDLFGHVGQMPQLLREAGLDNAVLWRGLSGEREGLKSELFWEAPDGSRVLCIHLPERSGYSNANDLPLNPDAALERIRGLRAEREAHAATPHLLLMNGTDHHGAQPELPELLRVLNPELQEEGARLVHSRLPEVVVAVRQAVDGVDLQVRRGELRDVNRSGTPYSNFLLYGVASARTYLKQANHAGQQALERYAEPWAATAWWAAGAPYPQGFLKQSWKYLLQNHPHDSICGCSLDPVHEQMMTRFQWSREIAGQVTTEALHQINMQATRPEIAAGLGGQAGDVAFRLFNSLPWARDGVWEATVYLPAESAARGFLVVDPAGNTLPHTVNDDRLVTRTVDHTDVQPAPRNVRERAVTIAFRAALPAMGYATFALRPLALPAWDRAAPSAADVRAGPAWLENEHLRVEVAPNGTLTLTDKGAGRRFAGLLLFEDGGDVGDEYTYSSPQCDRVLSSAGCQAAISLLETGPVTGRLRIDLTLPLPECATPERKAREKRTVACAVRSVVTLAAGARRLEIETTVDNRARDHRLRVLFPAEIRADRHVVDQAFDVTERPNDYPWPPAELWNEDPPQTHPQRLFVDLADVAGGLALLNQGIAEYGITGPAGGPRGLALTLLRCVAYLGGATYPSTIRGGAGPHLATPGAQCLGRHTFRYALVPHEGDWQAAGLVREANEYCAPPFAYMVEDTPPVPGREAPHLPRARFGLRESFLAVEGEHVLLSACKRREAPDERAGGRREGHLVVRLYNPTEQEQRARLSLRRGIRAAWRSNVLEEARESLPLLDGSLDLTLGPKKIVTVLLEPAALGTLLEEPSPAK
jgi:alpha-mannosidase